jgi:hypothetical protein
MTKSDGRDAKGKIMCEMRKTRARKDFGEWKHATGGLPEWPMGVMLVQEAFKEYDFQEVATLILLFTKIAALVLQTPQGVVRCLMGARLYYDATNVVGGDPLCPGVTDEDMFPSLLLPYLPRVLGLSDIELCGPDVRSEIKGAVARDRQLAARIDQLTQEGANPITLRSRCRI